MNKNTPSEPPSETSSETSSVARELVAMLCPKCWRHKIIEVSLDVAATGRLDRAHGNCVCASGYFGTNTPLLRHPDQAETRIAILTHERDMYKQLAEYWQKSGDGKDIELRAIKETLDRLGRSATPYPCACPGRFGPFGPFGSYGPQSR